MCLPSDNLEYKSTNLQYCDLQYCESLILFSNEMDLNLICALFHSKDELVRDGRVKINVAINFIIRLNRNISRKISRPRGSNRNRTYAFAKFDSQVRLL